VLAVVLGRLGRHVDAGAYAGDVHSYALVWPCTAIDCLPVPCAGRNVYSEISDAPGAIGGADSAAQSSSDVVRSPA
jgi:hypothetical protein